MPNTIDLLSLIGEQKTFDVHKLAEKLEIPMHSLRDILTDLARYNLVDYDEKIGKVKLPKWLSAMDKEIQEASPPTGAIILPRYREIKIQDVAVGNFTKNDLELKVRLKAGLKEIAICDVLDM